MRHLMMAVVLVATGASGAAIAQTPSGPQPQMVRRVAQPAPPPAYVGEAGEAALDVSTGLPVVTVEIHGQSYRFLLDTGAGGHGRLTAATAEALGLQPTGGEARATDGSGQVQTRRQFALDELSVAGVRFQGLTMTEVPGFPPGRGPQVDGILGVDLFASHTLTLDYAAGRLALGKTPLPASAVTYQRDRGGIGVTVRVGDVEVPVRLDTGNSVGALIVPEAVLAGIPRSGESRSAGRARTAISEIDIREQDLAVPVQLGSVVLPITRVTWPSLGEVGNLGSRGLAGSVVTLDQVNRRLDIRPSDAALAS